MSTTDGMTVTAFKNAVRAVARYVLADRDRRTLTLIIPGMVLLVAGAGFQFQTHDAGWSRAVYWSGWWLCVAGLVWDIVLYRKARRRNASRRARANGRRG